MSSTTIETLSDRCREVALSAFSDFRARELSNDVLIRELRAWVPALRKDELAAWRELASLYAAGYLRGPHAGPGGVARASRESYPVPPPGEEPPVGFWPAWGAAVLLAVVSTSVLLSGCPGGVDPTDARDLGAKEGE